MHEGIFLIGVIIILAILYDFTNGWNDAANAIATVVSTKVLTPMVAVLFAAVLNVLGAFYNTEVAKTIGKGIVDPKFLPPIAVVSALAGAVIWNVFLTLKGMPISITHSLVGAIMGAGIVEAGFSLSALKAKVVVKILVALLVSPLLGFIVAMIAIKLLFFIFRNANPSRANKWFARLQIISSAFMAFSHGANDAQNAMGIITAALFSGRFIKVFEVPYWVILLCATVIGLGTAVGGWRVIRTLGQRIYNLRTVHGFTAETTSALVILFATKLGIPISTTHVITSAVVGVGSSKRLSAVRWGIAFNILFAWIATIPACAIMSGIFLMILKGFFS